MADERPSQWRIQTAVWYPKPDSEAPRRTIVAIHESYTDEEAIEILKKKWQADRLTLVSGADQIRLSMTPIAHVRDGDVTNRLPDWEKAVRVASFQEFFSSRSTGVNYG